MNRRTPSRRPCTIDGCLGVAVKRGLCGRHYQRWRLNRPPNLKDRGCAVEGCRGRHHARGWCSTHYQRWRATGDPEATQGRYTYRSRPRAPRLPASIVVTTRLPPTLAAKAEHAAAVKGLSRGAYLRALVEQDCATAAPVLTLVRDG